MERRGAIVSEQDECGVVEVASDVIKRLTAREVGGLADRVKCDANLTGSRCFFQWYLVTISPMRNESLCSLLKFCHRHCNSVYS